MPEPYRTDQREEPARPSKRFDGTPGSLALDLSAMRQRYLRIRDTPIGSIADTRILDSAKLLRQGFNRHCGPERAGGPVKMCVAMHR
jgi:hypothetical protein